ncbi:uncharacterized protein A1O5_04611 [Cladophialophora psammophila CBS 110553]|uniref:Uncharacterized protein n=1 Tax=Cladophialophora psammophila CBS 110553 TaxID=1182543 RepID=W9WV78_9EURO|nr:uncharacterized protein A1O5_04611 [Cladophialophora psammophila CBS 110553]EXJ72107.1 hypothetical protein A1O5_04611 [Cladophialophora psammophila CBS 110553]
MPSKFTEILDPQYHTTSPQDDVRLEDIIGAADMSSRGRTPSEASSTSPSSSCAEGDQIDEKPRRKRLSRLLSGGKR